MALDPVLCVTRYGGLCLCYSFSSSGYPTPESSLRALNLGLLWSGKSTFSDQEQSYGVAEPRHRDLFFRLLIGGLSFYQREDGISKTYGRR
jgi:hypothetical protein